MDAIKQLRSMGYAIRVDQGQVHLKYMGSGLPSAAVVRPLISELRDRKAEAVSYLKAELVETETGILSPCKASDFDVGTLRSSPALIAAMGHPAYQPGRPICEQTEQVEELWWRMILTNMGRFGPGGKAIS